MLLSNLQPLLYIKISPELLTVRNVKTGAQLSEVPELAICGGNAKRVVLGFGANARAAAATATAEGDQSSEIINPFAHPRSLVSDFTVGQVLLKTFVKHAHRATVFAPSPRIVMHPLGSPAGGFTQIERRALREMALGAGASEVVLWIGRELSDQDVQSDLVLKNDDGRE
ncbi:MAG: rod shape-determining protein [Paucibacter sp.]|nr:rod shape-determining protein [Roseateles sp.]